MIIMKRPGLRWPAGVCLVALRAATGKVTDLRLLDGNPPPRGKIAGDD
jgi:hypothetical protein